MLSVTELHSSLTRFQMEADLNELAAGPRKYCTVILEQAQRSQATAIEYIAQSFFLPEQQMGMQPVWHTALCLSEEFSSAI